MSQSESSIFHVVETGPFARPILENLCDLTTAVRTVAKSHRGARELQLLLAGKRAMLYFTQASTRTFLSFNNACHVLGIRTSEIRDSSTSSEVKGESVEDSLRTFSSYVDVIIMRSWQKGLAARAADLMNTIPRPVPIINAGSGPDQHPTQALLDIYTLERSFAGRGGIDGKVIAMMGDLKRGRTVRSLSYLMKNYRDVKLVFIAPPAFEMEPDIKAFLRAQSIEFTETDNLANVLPELDAIYVTRIQAEYDTSGESDDIDLSRFSITPAQLPKLKADAIIMHPLPRGPELHPDVDADPRAVYWRQERNGMWMRAALLISVLGVEDEFRTLARDYMG